MALGYDDPPAQGDPVPRTRPPLPPFPDASGELMLGGTPARLPSAQGLQVRGRLSELDWDAWQQVRQRHAVSVDAEM